MFQTHLQFCKRYLDVKNKASNVARRAELVRLPENITTNQKNAHYLDLARGIADRKKLLKLQISNRKLMIELGIYNQTILGIVLYWIF